MSIATFLYIITVIINLICGLLYYKSTQSSIAITYFIITLFWGILSFHSFHNDKINKWENNKI